MSNFSELPSPSLFRRIGFDEILVKLNERECCSSTNEPIPIEDQPVERVIFAPPYDYHEFGEDYYENGHLATFLATGQQVTILDRKRVREDDGYSYEYVIKTDRFRWVNERELIVTGLKSNQAHDLLYKLEAHNIPNAYEILERHGYPTLDAQAAARDYRNENPG